MVGERGGTSLVERHLGHVGPEPHLEHKESEWLPVTGSGACQVPLHSYRQPISIYVIWKQTVRAGQELRQTVL